MSLTDATNSPSKRTAGKSTVSEVPESVALFFNGKPMAGKADKYMGELVADGHTLAFVGPNALPLPVLNKSKLAGAIGNLIASFPDLTFNLNKVAPKQNSDGSWSADIVVMGTHTGGAFSPQDGLPAIETTGTCVKIGPETFTLWTDAAGKVCKTEITPLGEGHPHGPPGFYLGIGGSLAPPAETVQDQNIKRVQFLVSEFMAGRPEGYLAGVSDDMKGSVLGGLIPNGDAFKSKEEFGALMGSMEQYMEVKKFEPCNWRAVGSDVLFNVNWEFVWKPTGKTIETTAVVRKVLRDNMICEKYHMVDVEAVTSEKHPDNANVARVKQLLDEYLAGRPEGYLAGVSDDMKGSVLGGLIPNGDAFKSKEEFGALMGSMEQYMEVKKFEPCNWRAVGSDVLFNVNWEFVWKPTGKTIETTAVVRKVLRDNMICEKYHMVDVEAVKNA